MRINTFKLFSSIKIECYIFSNKFNQKKNIFLHI